MIKEGFKMDYNSTTNQRIKGKFVEREVVYNVSMLIYELNKIADSLDHEDQHELLNISAIPDYETAIDHEVNSWERDECLEYLENLAVDCQDDEPIEDLREAVAINAVEEGADDFCHTHNIDYDYREAYEHWIVTGYLAKKLETHGQMVGEVMGLTVWGRTTTGQAILLDGVISGICEEIEILEGQQYEWKV